jgi:protein-arginine kinase activator protein McsA
MKILERSTKEGHVCDTCPQSERGKGEQKLNSYTEKFTRLFVRIRKQNMASMFFKVSQKTQFHNIHITKKLTS